MRWSLRNGRVQRSNSVNGSNERLLVVQGVELGSHRGVVLGQFLHREVLCFVVGQSVVVARLEQLVLGLLQFGDGFVDSLDGLRELAAGQVIIPAEFLLEVLQVAFKILNVDVLGFDDLQLVADLNRLQGSVAKERDDGDEELWAHHVHLVVFVRHVGDAIVELIVGFQHGHENGILAALGLSVFVEFFEEILVLFLGLGRLSFVFHLKHDAEEFDVVPIRFLEDVIAFGAL